MADIIFRADAKAAGLKWYFTGKPCIHGHVAVRKVADKICRECRRLYSSKRYAADRDQANASRRARFQARRDVERESRRQRYWDNPDAARAATLNWAKENPDKANHQARTKRARKRAAGGTHTLADVVEIMGLQDRKCAYCRVPLDGIETHVDHIKPLSRGGSNARQNIQMTCAGCNLRKHARDPIEFAKSLGRLL